MVQLERVSLRYGDKTVLENCSLRLAPGERLALMGPSGCGKTSLLRLALGLEKPDSGSRRLRATRLGVVFQEPRLLPWLTAEENVNLVLTDREDSLPDARLWLERMGLAAAAKLRPEELSGGMQQRLAIARALAREPELLVLDEPFKAMDEALHMLVLNLMREAMGGAALLLATHSEEEARALDCRILRYHRGRFLAED